MSDNKCVRCGAVIPEGRQVCPNCEFFSAERKIVTNADRIRVMSDEELAEEICYWINVVFEDVVPQCVLEEINSGNKKTILEFLQSPVEENKHDRK